MGLDVYLYRYDRPASEIEAAEDEYQSESTRIWNEVCGDRPYGDVPQDQKDEYRKRVKVFAESKGLGEWGEVPGREMVELPSAKYPDHGFKIGYFRSSYNTSGIDHILSDRIGVTLGSIMDAGDEYAFTPDWEASLDRARQASTDFKAYIDRNGSYRVIKTSIGFGQGVNGEEDALRLFHKEREKYEAKPKEKGPFAMNAYSNADGSYFFGDEASKLVALFVDKNSFLGPHALAVVETPGADDYYVQALEIVIETIEWVIAQPDREKYRLHWSS